MTLVKLCSMAAVALALSGCVVLDTAPIPAAGPGPFLTGGTTTAPAPSAPAPSLRNQLAGRTLVLMNGPFGTLPSIYLRDDGGWSDRFGEPIYGTWRISGGAFCMSAGGPDSCSTASVSGNQLTLSNQGDTLVYRIE